MCERADAQRHSHMKRMRCCMRLDINVHDKSQATNRVNSRINRTGSMWITSGGKTEFIMPPLPSSPYLMNSLFFSSPYQLRRGVGEGGKKKTKRTSLISPVSFKPGSKVDRINWSLSMREGTASGPLSTTPRHICQIRGISPTCEPPNRGEGGRSRGGRRRFAPKSLAASNTLS